MAHQKRENINNTLESLYIATENDKSTCITNHEMMSTFP